MSIHNWARTALERNLEVAKARGFTEELALRALLSVVVERSAAFRSVEDLAQELLILADNLDPEQDYSFIRP